MTANPPTTTDHLADLRNKQVTVFLANKTALHGKLRSYDNNDLTLEENGKITIVSRMHVTTIKEN